MTKLTPTQLAERRARHKPGKVYLAYAKRFGGLSGMRLDPTNVRHMEACLKSGVDTFADEKRPAYR